jgi:hypothetical protein
MRSPDLPEILIAAGLVAYIACAVHNWLHSKGQGQKSTSNSYAEKAAQASERAPHIASGTAELSPGWLQSRSSRWVLRIDANGVRSESELE